MIDRLLVLITRLAVGATPMWIGCRPQRGQRIYFANHSSHLDTLALWTALPPELRSRTRPVAAKDYWGKTALRRRIAVKGLRAVLIERGGQRGSRDHDQRTGDPLQPLAQALEAGDSLILFPEGTRRESAEPGDFRAGIFHLSRRFPEVDLIPVYLDNLHRSMPKGSFLPLPFLCRVRFGAPLRAEPGEAKADFLGRARDAVLDLK